MAENEKDTLGAIMARNPATIKPDASVRKALQLMIKKDIGSLIVVKNGEPLGIITERDVTRLSLRLAQAVYERPVTRLMTRPLITLPPTTPVWEALDFLNYECCAATTACPKDMPPSPGGTLTCTRKRSPSSSTAVLRVRVICSL